MPASTVRQECQVTLFGGPVLWYGNRSANRFRTQKTRGLLAYLAFHADRMHSRDTLREMFWYDSALDAGFKNLYVAQSAIRQLVVEGLGMNVDILRTERQRIGLNTDWVSVDTARFENLLDAAEGLPDGDALPLLQNAVALYEGPLLPALYDDWITAQQVRLADRFFQASRRLSQLYQTEGHLEASLQCLRRVVTFDPAHVDAASLLIHRLIEAGQAAEAARTFHELQHAIGAKCGADVEGAHDARHAAIAELGDLYHVIEPHLNAYQRRTATASGFRKRARKPGKTDERLFTAPVISAGGVATLPAPRIAPVEMGTFATAPRDMPAATPMARGLPPGLPLPLTRFFGRDDEMLRLGWLLGDPSARLITLLGPGGGGKTRLALSVAQERQRRRGGGNENGDVWNIEPSPFPELCDDGDESDAPGSDSDVLFLTFTDADTPPRLPEMLADALGARLPVRDEADLHPHAPWTQNALDILSVALHGRPGLLLILDNFDVLAQTDAAPFLERLLTQATQLKVLATSRRRIPVVGERIFPVAPLPTPSLLTMPDLERADPTQLLAEWPSIALFVDRARLANPTFQLTRRNVGAVAQIVSRLDGLPLAIELAAARCGTMEPHRLLRGLDDRFGLLVTSPYGAADRRHSLRESLLFSYRLLSPALQRLFCRLSVFRGGFTLDAAIVVGDDAQAHDHLAQLADASLVQVRSLPDETLRFDLLETVRGFGAEQFAHAPQAEQDAVRLRHARFFVALAEDAKAHLSGPEQSAWLERLDTDLPNLRAALTYCLDENVVPAESRETAMRLGVALTPYWHWRGMQTEGARSLRAVLDRWDEFSGDLSLNDPAGCRRLAQIWNGVGVLKMSRRDWDGARVAYQRGLLLWQEIGDAAGIAASRNNRAMLEQQTGDLETAQAEYEASLLYWRSAGDDANAARVLNNLSTIAILRGQHRVAQITLAESLALTRQTGDALGFASRLHNLGELALECGKPEKAYSYYQSSLSYARASGNWQLCAANLAGLALLRLETAPRDREGSRLLSVAMDYLRATEDSLSPIVRASLSRLGFDYLFYPISTAFSEAFGDEGDGFPAIGELFSSAEPPPGEPLSLEAAREQLQQTVDVLLAPPTVSPTPSAAVPRW